MANILVVEDDAAIGESLARLLRREGHRVALVADGVTAEQVARSGTADLVLLDLGLPGRNGLEVVRHLRESGSKIPVIVVTALTDEVDLVVGLDAGADDYVTKPFRSAEVLARTRALLRRANPPAARQAGPLRVDPSARSASVGDQELRLTPKEFEILAILAEEPGVVVAKQELVRRVWQRERLDDSKTLNMHMSTLRRKLAGAQAVDGPQVPQIRSVRGVGFILEEA